MLWGYTVQCNNDPLIDYCFREEIFAIILKSAGFLHYQLGQSLLVILCLKNFYVVYFYVASQFCFYLDFRFDKEFYKLYNRMFLCYLG